MTTYEIMHDVPSGVRLHKDDHPDAKHPFDGGSIHYAPETYPATICSFRFGKPTYAADRLTFDVPVSYSNEMLDYHEIIVNNPDEWRAAACAYLAGTFTEHCRQAKLEAP